MFIRLVIAFVISLLVACGGDSTDSNSPVDSGNSTGSTGSSGETAGIDTGGDINSSDSTGGSGVAAISASAARGKELYESPIQNCVACHGVDGKSSVFKRIDLLATAYEHSSTPGVSYTPEDYMARFMPVGNPGICVNRCAEDIVAYMRYLGGAELNQTEPPLPPEPAVQPGPPVPPEPALVDDPGIVYFRLENRATGQLIQPRNCSAATDETVALSQTTASGVNDCNTFSFSEIDKGSFIIQNKQTTGNIRPETCSTKEDESVEIRQVGGNFVGTCVQWEVFETDNGYFFLSNKATGRKIRPLACAKTSSRNNSVSIVQVPDNYNGNCTQWRLLDEEGNVASLPANTVPQPPVPQPPVPQPPTPQPPAPQPPAPQPPAPQPPTPQPPAPQPPATQPPSVDIQVLMRQADVNCTNSGCHDSSPGTALVDLQSGSLEDIALRLVSRPALSSSCQGELLIDPDNIDNSILLKLIDPSSGSQCTAKMPLGKTGVTPDQYDQFVDWVNELVTAAPPVMVVTPPVSAPPTVAASLSPLTVANKAKMILHGGAVTDSELAQITNANGGLQVSEFKNLLYQWMSTPEFITQFNDFSEVTTQQRFTDGSDRYANVFGFLRNMRNVDSDAMRRVLQESYVRTVTRIVTEGDDFRKAIYTSDWVVTTANLVALASADGAQPFRRLVDHPGLRESDYNDWRRVRIQSGNRPIDYQQTQAFTNRMRAIREGDTISLYAPRFGPMNTPIFMENWLTNVDNQFRLNVNQSVIVALGKSFEVSDQTRPNHASGLDRDHAAPGTDCAACHDQLDPMRNVFMKYYSFNNMRTKARQTNENPDFAFHGVRDNITNMRDFTVGLANHPLFAPAWLQKFCHWSSSASCDENHPAFNTVVNRFKDSGYNFKTLIAEYMASPLFSQADSNTGAVSIARYHRFCTSLKTRLEGVREYRNLPAANMDFCNITGANRAFSSIIPSGTFIRGEIDLSLPSQNDFISVKAVESLCATGLNRILGGDTNSTFSTQRVSEGLDDMTSFIFGTPPSSARFTDIRDTLQNVYDISRKAPACSNPSRLDLNAASPSCGLNLNSYTSLQVVWRMACSSPSLTGVGLE
ncbi:MAG: cytochrome c [Pseudomonadota bacterium]